MSKPLLLITMVILLCFYYTQSIAQSIIGSWENELGSILQIDSLTNDQQIQGVYRSSSGVDGKIFPLQGSINSSESNVIAVAFSVRWEGYGSITSWTGFLDRDEGGPFIKTLWHLVRPDEEEQWERIITNASTFRMIDPEK